VFEHEDGNVRASIRCLTSITLISARNWRDGSNYRYHRFQHTAGHYGACSVSVNRLRSWFPEVVFVIYIVILPHNGAEAGRRQASSGLQMTLLRCPNDRRAVGDQVVPQVRLRQSSMITFPVRRLASRKPNLPVDPWSLRCVFDLPPISNMPLVQLERFIKQVAQHLLEAYSEFRAQFSGRLSP
jgi:hypothetical protein